MRSRAVRLIFGAVAWAAIGAAAFFIFQSEKKLTVARSALGVFDLRAREATDALAEVRAAQQAYVAAGQGVAFWVPKVAATLETIRSAIAALDRSATIPAAHAAIRDAGAAVTEFASVDTRAREYLQNDQPLMAGDVVFTEGGDTAPTRRSESRKPPPPPARPASPP
jgi:hypothetical protein